MPYFDYAASAPRTPAAMEALLDCPLYGNPNSHHLAGAEMAGILNKAKKIIAQEINCLPEEVHFTPSATEACHWALSIMSSYCHEINYHRYEHAAVLEYADNLKNGNLNPDGEYIGFAQMLVNNVLGCIYEMPEKTENNLILCDATAAMGHMKVDFKELNIDYLAFGGHKFGALIGVGALIVRKGAPFRELNFGTPAPELAYSMAMALQYANQKEEELENYLGNLKKLLIDSLQETPGFHLNVVEGYGCLNTTINISFDKIKGDVLAETLSNENCYVSTGSACSDFSSAPYDIFVENGLTREAAKNSIRITFGIGTTLEDIEYLSDKIRKIVNYFQSVIVC